MTTSPIQEALMELQDAERMQDSEQALQVAGQALGKLTREDRAKLLSMPAVQKLISDTEEKAVRTGEPGATVCDDKGNVLARIPETAEHMKATLPMVTWTPMQTRTISFQGVSTQVIAGRPITTPEAYRDIANEAWQAENNQLETAKEIMMRNFGENSVILGGDGVPLWQGNR